MSPFLYFSSCVVSGEDRRSFLENVRVKDGRNARMKSADLRPIVDSLRIRSYAGRSARTRFDERISLRRTTMDVFDPIDRYRRANDDQESVERTGSRRTLGRRVIAVFPPAFARSVYRR